MITPKNQELIELILDNCNEMKEDSGDDFICYPDMYCVSCKKKIDLVKNADKNAQEYFKEKIHKVYDELFELDEKGAPVNCCVQTLREVLALFDSPHVQGLPTQKGVGSEVDNDSPEDTRKGLEGEKQ